MDCKKPRDMFVEAGYGPNFADQLIQNAFSKLFEGDPIDERVCFEACCFSRRRIYRSCIRGSISCSKQAAQSQGLFVLGLYARQPLPL